MNPIAHRLITVALLSCLAACGNKGPLVHPTAPQSELPAPASSQSPAPTQVAPPANPPPADTDPGVAPPPPAPSDGSGHG